MSSKGALHPSFKARHALWLSMALPLVFAHSASFPLRAADAYMPIIVPVTGFMSVEGGASATAR